MPIKMFNRKKRNYLAPVFTGEKYLEKVRTQLFKYNTDDFVEIEDSPIDTMTGFTDLSHQYWLNIHGIHDVDKIWEICSKLNVHNLAVQDILDVNQRPKFQEYEDYWFFSIKAILPETDNEIALEQLSFILGKNYLVSFQEKKADHFDHVRRRIREKTGIVRDRTSDYLLFLLLEAILDTYFSTIDVIDQQIEKFEIIEIDADPSPSILKSIEFFKRQIHTVKKLINPIKDFVTRIEREEFNLIDRKHIKYFFELKDLCLTLVDDCEKIEVRLESSINLFFSIQGHRMNQVMKTLTIVATIFIPLTFIVGIYGMNFSFMPELTWKWGYFGVWGLIIAITISMMLYFKRKKWF